MADETSIVTTIIQTIGNWTIKTVFVIMLLLMPLGIYYLYTESAKEKSVLQEKVDKLREEKAAVSAELAGCKMEAQYLKRK